MSQADLPFESDMALFFRARAIGWEPAAEHTRDDPFELLDGWRESARTALASRRQTAPAAMTPGSTPPSAGPGVSRQP